MGLKENNFWEGGTFLIKKLLWRAGDTDVIFRRLLLLDRSYLRVRESSWVISLSSMLHPWTCVDWASKLWCVPPMDRGYSLRIVSAHKLFILVKWWGEALSCDVATQPRTWVCLHLWLGPCKNGVFCVQRLRRERGESATMMCGRRLPVSTLEIKTKLPSWAIARKYEKNHPHILKGKTQ